MPAEWIDLPVDELGLRLLAWWIAAQAERKGIDPTAIPEHIAEQIIIATRGMDGDQAHIAALEKALIKAAQGEFAKAGTLLHGYMQIGAESMAAADLISNLEPDTKRGGKVRRGAKRGHELVHGDSVTKETRRRQYLDLMDEIKAKNPCLTGQSLHKAAEKQSSKVLGKRVSYKTFERTEKNEHQK